MLANLSSDSDNNNIDDIKKNSEDFWNLIEEKWLDYWAKNNINNSDLDYSRRKVFHYCGLSVSKFSSAYWAWKNLYFGGCACSLLQIERI